MDEDEKHISPIRESDFKSLDFCYIDPSFCKTYMGKDSHVQVRLGTYISCSNSGCKKINICMAAKYKL